jgi:Zn-dependent protease
MNFLTNSPIYTLLSGDFTGFILEILYLLPALVIAVSFHEFAHAWMANKMGDPTAKNLGRMTLDPTKHFDLWGFLMLLLVGFGWGKPTPVNPRNFYNYKKGNILVSLAGVITNLILSFLFYIIFRVLMVLGVTSEAVLTIILYIVLLNIVLFFFNLIPIPPLDGHHLIKGWIARRSQNFYMIYQRYGFMLLIAIMLLTNWISIALNFIATQILSLYSMFFGLFV